LTPGYWGYVGTKSSLITSAGQITVNFGSVIENLIGSAYSDSLYGNQVGNIIDGGSGNDSVEGWDGNDTLNGGLGTDKLNGGAGTDTFVFAAGDSGQATGFDIVNDYTKGALGMGDLIDYSVDLVRASSSVVATATKASVNQTTGVATFASDSGTTLADGLADCSAATTAAGQFALFRVGGAGNYYMFISDGTTGVTANDVVVQLVGVTSLASIDLAGGNLTITG
jgi:Ca2+-binding RTX toxin-like protein